MNDHERDAMSTEVEPSPETRPRRKWVLPLAIVLGLAAVVWGGERWRYAAAHESTNDAFVGGRLVPVLSRVGGFVTEVFVAENTHVDAGEILAVIDSVELQQDVVMAEAALAAARAAAGSAGIPGEAQAAVTAALRRQAAAAAQLDAARADAERATKDLARTRDLAEQEIVSRQALDGAVAEERSARAHVTALEQEQAAAEAAVVTARAGGRGADARLESARAALDQARLRLSYARITAPVTGTVSQRSVEPGQLLQPGQPILTVVADTGTYVTANFKETQLADLRVGEAVEIEVDAYDGCSAGGRVESIGGATGSQFALIPADNATGNFTKVVQRVPVRIALERTCGDEHPLRPGMSVVVHVEKG